MVQRNKKIIFGLTVCILLIALAVLFILPEQEAASSNEQASQESAESDYHYLNYQGKEYEFDSSIISILFMGVDTSDPEVVGQADSLQLYLFDRNDEKIEVINISRDTMTEIKLFDVSHNEIGWEKQHLALQFAYGESMENGAMLTCQAVSRLFNDIPINYFVAMDLSKLSILQEIVGTLAVVVPNDSLVEIDPSWTAGSTIEINSDNVEKYVRSRDIEHDFSNMYRMERQKSYLNAYMIKIQEMIDEDIDNTVTKLYNISKQLVTNISLTDIQNFAAMVQTYSYDEQTDFYTLAGENVVGVNHDEFEVDNEALMELLVKLFYKEG